MSEKLNLDQIREKADKLVEQSDLQPLFEMESELNKLIEETSEEPEIRLQISQIKSKIYRKRRALEHIHFSNDEVLKLIRDNRFAEALDTIEEAIGNRIVTPEHVVTLRLILHQEPQTINQIKSILDQLPETQMSGDAQIFLRELTVSSEPSQAFDNTPKITRTEIQTQGSTSDSNIEADKIITKGDGAYYSGNIVEAAKLYQKVLDLDPSRERARQRLHDIGQGNIPIIAVPVEAGSAFGRALSLYRRGNYVAAAAQAQKAIDLMGGVFWKDAQELLNRCYTGQQAEEAYQEALIMEQNGQWATALREYNASIALLPDNPLYRDARDRLSLLINEVNVIQAGFSAVRNINDIIRLSHVQEKIKSLERHTSSQRVQDIQADFDNVIMESSKLLEKPERSVDDSRKLFRAKEIAEDLLVMRPESSAARSLLNKLSEMMSESALWLAMDFAEQGDLREAKELLKPYAHSPEAKKALKEITKRYKDELIIAFEFRTKELGDLRKQRALWFSLSVTSSVLAGVLLLIASISTVTGNLSAGIISVLSSILPSAFVMLFLNQYKDLNEQLHESLKKSPEIERLERLAILSGSGVENGE